MLGKLLKYDFKALARLLLPLYGGLLALGLITGFMLPVTDSSDNVLIAIAVTVLVILLVVLTVASFVLTLIMMIKRFHKSLLADEGYLSHSLPVTTEEHLLSKTISSFVFYLVATLCAGMTYVILIVTVFARSEGLPSWDQVGDLWNEVMKHITAEGWVLFWLFILLMLIQIIGKCLKIFTAMLIGHMANDHKIFFSFLSWIGLTAVESIITRVLTFTQLNSSSIYMTTLSEDIVGVSTPLVIGSIIMYVVFIAVYFVLSDLIMKKKLNLA